MIELTDKGDNIEVFLVDDQETISKEVSLFDDESILEEFGINKEFLKNNGIPVEAFLNFASNHAKKDVEKLVNKLKETKEISSVEENDNTSENNINLNTKSVKSLITGEEIDLTKYDMYARIGEIYYHTGVSITLNDPLFVSEGEKGVKSFNNLLCMMGKAYVKEAKEKLGPNWQQVLTDNYIKAWNRIMNEKIEKENRKAETRLKEYKESKSSKVDEESVKSSESTRVKVRRINKEELLGLKKDLLESRRTAIVSENGAHVILKGDAGTVQDNLEPYTLNVYEDDVIVNDSSNRRK